MDRTRALVLVGLLAATALAGCTAGPTRGPRGLMQEALAAGDAVDRAGEALDRGYEPTGYCVPGVGVHWIHADDLDTELDPAHPEAVIFLPTTSNLSDPTRQRFMGIAYIAVTQGTANNTTGNPPRLMDVPLDGPHPPDDRVPAWHADLRIYMAEEHQSNTSFPRSMPGIECPKGTTAPGGDPARTGGDEPRHRARRSVSPVAP